MVKIGRSEMKIVLFKYFLVFHCILLTSLNAISREDSDSLIRQLETLKGKQKLEVLENLSLEYSVGLEADKYFKYSRDGLEYALSEHDSSYISTFLIELGYYYKLKHAYQEALNSFNRSILISTRKGYKRLLANGYTGLGTIYLELNLYDKALANHSKSLTIKEEIGNNASLGVSYNNIGLIYYKIDDPIRALENFEKSLNIKLLNGDTARTILNNINLGLAYSELDGKKEGEQAISFFKEAIKLSEKYNRPHRVGHAYNGLAKVYIKLLNYDSAKYYLNLSVEESFKNNYKLLESSNYFLFAKIAFQEGNYGVAVNYLDRSQALLVKLNDKSRIKNNYGLYSDIYAAEEMLDSAYFYQKKFSIMKDSIFNEELANNLANVQIAAIEEQSQRKLDDKDETISNTKLFSFFLLSVLTLSVVLIVVIFKNFTQTNRINLQLNESKNKIEVQKKNLEKKNKLLADAQVTIQEQNDELKNINIDLDKINIDLDKKVQERTAELDRSNHELEKAVKDLDQFIYKTSHDLRGPIATMQGIISLGEMEAREEQSKIYFNTLHNVANNLNNVLIRLIEVHETYQKKLVIEPLDPMQEILEITDKIAHFSAEKGVSIETDLQINGPWNSDKKLFNQIVDNMVRSAMLYKDRGNSVILVKADLKDEELKIVVEDNGFGIQPGDEDKVFNIFFKGSPRPGGTGLEIYTAKIAIEKLGGMIHLRNAAKNTIFEIALPILKK